jgi:hypothetical protein
MTPRHLPIAACTMLLALLTPAMIAGQKVTQADVAAKMSGSWKLNRELSPSLANPGGRGRGLLPSFQPTLALQRGGGRGGGTGGGAGGGENSPLMDAEVAAQAALTVLNQVPLELTIAATVNDVVFKDPRGEWAFKLDDKTSEMEVPRGTVKVKSKWDRLNIKQEFSSSQRKLIRFWSIDSNDRLVLTSRIESLTFNSVEAKAVFDRQ